MKLTGLALATVVLLLVSFLFLVSLAQKTTIGSFMYTRGSVPFTFRLGDRYPDRKEFDQCGPIRTRIKRNSKLYITDLVTNTNPDIIFKSADAHVMTSRLQTRLNALAKRFLGEFSTKITVLKSWSESSIEDSNSDSLHYEGRTVRVHVNGIYISILLQLAIDVGFDWVYFDSIDYIRLSVIPDTCRGKIDLVFMLDLSGSMGRRNHDITLRFIHDVVSFYNISANQTRVGMLTYSTNAHIEFPLDKYQDLPSLHDALMEIRFHSGWTSTAWGLFFATKMLNPDEGYGARQYSEGIPKIAILITHGVSNMYPIVEYATDLRNSGVQVFIVGIGNVFLPELLTIASDPDVQHVFLLQSFSDAPYFVNFLSVTTCDAPAIVDPGKNTTTDVEEDHFRYFQSFCSAFSQTVMIEQIDIIGTCSLYASASVQNPGPLDPSSFVVRNEDSTGEKRSVTLQPSKDRYVYIAVRGLALYNTFTVIIWDIIFEKNEYNISVPGGVTVSSLFNLTEVLQTTNITFNFTITEGSKSDYFGVGLQSGIVELIHPLNASQNVNLLLIIVAQNSHISCQKGRVQLRIAMCNDTNSPNLDLVKINDEIEFSNLDPVKISNEIKSLNLYPTNIGNEIESADLDLVRVSETASRGSVVTKIQVLGGSNQFSYSLGEGNMGNAFAIDTTTGIITVYAALNFEVQDSYNLTVIATRNQNYPTGIMQTESTIQVVQVLDINEIPTFTNACVFSSTCVCSFTVIENDPNSVIVGTLIGEDPDLPNLPNGQVTFSFEAILPPTAFYLIQVGETVTIVKNETFDREETAIFILTIRITDGGSPPLSSTLVVKVFVDDVNDNAPVFVLAPRLFNVSESTAVGTAILQYQTTDRDNGVNAEITYSLTSIINSATLPFEIDPINGLLSVSSPLDFEVLQSYFLRITACNPDGLSTEIATNIIIVDVNDNPPIFDQSVYNASVSEGDPVGTFVLLVEATDGDFGKDTFNYSIKNGDFNNSFVISENGAISLSCEVDREVIQMFNLSICVTDFGVPSLSSFATVLIHVSDINDNPPIFTQERHEIFIREDVESLDIITVTAFDSDEPLSPNSMINFNLDQSNNIGGVFNLMQIDNNNSVLHLIGLLRFETLEIYELHILATDQGSPPLSNVAKIVVNVMYVKAFPVIISGNKTILVSEAAPSGSMIAQINITCLDCMEWNFSILSVSNSNTIGKSGKLGMLFDIDSNGVVSIREELDFESIQNFTITIQVSNREESLIVFLTVNIVDENEFPPIFKEVGNFSVEEEESSGTFIGKVVAVDGDTGPMSGVTYAILQDSVVSSLFSIDSQLGNIFTTQVLDREKLVEQNLFLPSRGSSDVIIVVATDTEVPFRSSTLAVTIILMDINDNSPIIQSFPESLSVPENVMKGELLVQIIATDRDIGSNGEINFTLVVLEPVIPSGQEAPFVISSSGEITTNAILDREARSTNVSLMANDNGQPPNNSIEVRFSVLVTDVNDNAPVFSNDSYEISVPENVILDSALLLVSAKNADNSNTKSEISFVIISSYPPNSAGIFNISSTGLITVVMPLDYESVRTHFLVIEAVDSGTPAMFSRANVTIRVENVDEAPPVFVRLCSVTILETRIQIGSSIEQCFAVDIIEATGQPNFSSPLVYSIISGNFNDTFSIDGTGSVIVERPIDREELDFYSLTVQVVNPDGLTASTFVNVTISDVNDNTPIITNKDLFQNVDSSDIWSGENRFFTVTAMDADIGANAKLYYVLYSSVVSVDGMHVNILVTVSDSGVPPLSSSVIITLNFDMACFLQDHVINATDGDLTSHLLCNVILEPANVDVMFGGVLELACSVPVSNIQPTSFEFIHNNSVVSVIDSNLVIRNMTFETGGDYICKVVSDIGSLQSDNGIVRMLLPSDIILAPLDMLVQEGRETKIECLTTGIPKSTITWTRVLKSTGIQEDIVDNPANHFFIDGGILIIISTSLEDQGTYSCTATNLVGKISSTFVLSMFQLSTVVQVQVVMFSNISMSSGTACHDANWLKFEMALYEITGALARVTNQNGDNLCNNTPCSSNPCQNNGICTLPNTSLTGFECTCNTGYTGINCKIDIDECIDDPCHFGGTCANTPSGSFTCTCSQGTTGHRCQFQDVCSSITCPSSQTCVLTLTNMASYICQNLAQENLGLLRVTTRGDSSVQALGTLDDQVNTFQEGNDNSNMEVDETKTNRLMTSCEARFIPDPNFSQKSVNFLVLVWACPAGVFPPLVDKLNAICTFLYASKLVTSCTSSSGMVLSTNPMDLPNTTFTFSFVLLDSNKFPMSGKEALTLLLETDAISKLRARGYQVIMFVLASRSSMHVIVGVTVGILLVLAGIILIVALTYFYYRSKVPKKKIFPIFDQSTQKDENHLEKRVLQESPAAFSPTFPLQRLPISVPGDPGVSIPLTHITTQPDLECLRRTEQ